MTNRECLFCNAEIPPSEFWCDSRCKNMFDSRTEQDWNPEFCCVNCRHQGDRHHLNVMFTNCSKCGIAIPCHKNSDRKDLKVLKRALKLLKLLETVEFDPSKEIQFIGELESEEYNYGE